jgi:hypothetical protein
VRLPPNNQVKLTVNCCSLGLFGQRPLHCPRRARYCPDCGRAARRAGIAKGDLETMSGQHSCRLASRHGEPGRFFLCVRCRAQVLICPRCDRGQIYCNGGCAHEARRQKRREAGRRYQASAKGRAAHALRARRHRARQKSVTHQGPPSPSRRDDRAGERPAATEIRSSSRLSLPTRPSFSCQWCKCRCSQFVRQHFLRRGGAYRTARRNCVRRRPP